MFFFEKYLLLTPQHLNQHMTNHCDKQSHSKDLDHRNRGQVNIKIGNKRKHENTDLRQVKTAKSRLICENDETEDAVNSINHFRW